MPKFTILLMPFVVIGILEAYAATPGVLDTTDNHATQKGAASVAAPCSASDFGARS